MREYTYTRTNPIIDDSWIGTLKTDRNTPPGENTGSSNGNTGSSNKNKSSSNGTKNTI